MSLLPDDPGTCLYAPTPRERRLPPAKKASHGARLRAIWQIAQAAIIFGLIGWLIWAGAQNMNYAWQWHRVQPFFYHHVGDVFIWGPLMKGLFVTLKLTAAAAILTLLIGTITALARLSDGVATRWLSSIYLEAIRNTPLLVQLFLFYFVLAPIFGIDRFWAGVLCLAFFEGAFAAEIIRGGIVAVDKGQREAAAAIGLNRLDSFRFVIAPQALPLILPPLTGTIISLIKHSAIVSVIAVAELTTEGLNLIADTFMAFEIWFLIAGIYLALTITLSVGVSLLEHRMTRGRRTTRPIS